LNKRIKSSFHMKPSPSCSDYSPLFNSSLEILWINWLSLQILILRSVNLFTPFPTLLFLVNVITALLPISSLSASLSLYLPRITSRLFPWWAQESALWKKRNHRKYIWRSSVDSSSGAWDNIKGGLLRFNYLYQMVEGANYMSQI
jgi:hypothetical protein